MTSSDLPFPVDLYIPFVDGNDIDYAEAMAQCAARSGEDSDNQDTAGLQRINNFGQLRLALRSVAACLPWIRRVHVVFHAQRQLPQWLASDSPRLAVHLHRDYFDPAVPLPTFSSFVIDSQMDRVPGLSEHFIYLEDDAFICQPLSPGDFFAASGRPRLDYQVAPGGMAGWHDPGRYQENALGIWPNQYKFSNHLWKRALDNDSDNELRLADDHRPLPLLKSFITATNRRFSALYSESIGQRFRRGNVLSLHAYVWGMAYCDLADSTPPWSLYRTAFPGPTPDLNAIRESHSACINDDTAFTDEAARLDGVRRYSGMVRHLTEQLFPAATEFERPLRQD